MKCISCDYRVCAVDECQHCDEVICTGYCARCQPDNECSYCKKVIKISEGNHITTVMYSYYCNRDCYDKRGEK